METDADRNHDQHNASRNLNIELLRVIAVFSIVFYHYFITMLPLPSYIYFFFEALAQVAMITFFTISGFGLYLHFEKSYRSYPQFLKHRLSHLLPHYYLSIIFVIVSSGTVFLSTWGINIVISYFLCIQNLSLTWQSNINGVTWTVALMVQFYLISPLIYRLIKLDSRFVCLFIIIASILSHSPTHCYMPFLSHIIIRGVGSDDITCTVGDIMGDNIRNRIIGIAYRLTPFEYPRSLKWGIMQNSPKAICMQYDCILLPHDFTRQSLEQRVDFLSICQFPNSCHIYHCHHRHAVFDVAI